MANDEQIRELLKEILKQEKAIREGMAEIAVSEETRNRWLTMETANEKTARQALALLKEQPCKLCGGKGEIEWLVETNPQKIIIKPCPICQKKGGK